MADLFKTAGADRLITVDLHADQIQGFFDGPVDHLFALPMLADYVKSKLRSTSELTVVSPDAGRVRVAERWIDAPRRRAAGDHPQAPRPRYSQRGDGHPRSSGRSRAGPASSSTT